MRVTVGVHGRFHGFDLARELAARQALEVLATTYPAVIARRFVGAEMPLATAPWLELLRRGHGLFSLPGSTDLIVATAFARFLARHLGDADVLVGWSGATLDAIPAARDRGMKIVLERGSAHIQHQTEVLRAEYGRWGLTARTASPRLIERELAEYELADIICTGSSGAAATFLERGITPDKVRVNPYGVDLSAFRPPAHRHQGRVPVILFVGLVGLRKGIPFLLQAFAPLAERAELHLVGPLEPGMEAVLARLPMISVKLAGPLHGAALRQAYADADLFCLPSFEEGFGMVILQAMASGLPVVATTATGAVDIVEHEASGLIIPPGDIAALRDALAGLATDPPRRREMGEKARAAVEDGWQWSDYGDRAITLYQSILTQPNSLAPQCLGG